jgi:hypothetical protein
MQFGGGLVLVPQEFAVSFQLIEEVGFHNGSQLGDFLC